MPPKKRKISKPSDMEPKSKKQELMNAEHSVPLTSDFETLLRSGEEEIQNADSLIKVALNKEFDLTQEIQRISDQEKSNLWSTCQSLLGQALLSLLEASTDGGLGQTKEVIAACISFAKATIETSGTIIPAGLEKSTIMLHESLLVLPKSMEALKNEITKLCEIWLLKGLPGKEKLAVNACIYLLQKTILPSGTKVDIKRLNGFFEANAGFNVFDEKMKNSLLKCVQSSNFFRSQEGQKFIANLMKISPAFIKEIHKAFKGIISSCSKQDGCQIGEIYLKAWSINADNAALRQQIEDCIQNLMYHCILANKKSKIFEPLLAILLPFHSLKNNTKVQQLLQNLWEPLLWRYLKVANSDVRCNATQILSDAFPLENPEDELEVRAAAQEQQIKVFQGMNSHSKYF